MKKTSSGIDRIHWAVIIGALAAMILFVGTASGGEHQFLMLGKINYFFAHSLCISKHFLK